MKAILLLLAGVVWAESLDWMPWLARRIVKSASKHVDLELRERMSEEWQAELAAIPGKISPLLFSFGVWSVAVKQKVLHNTLIGAQKLMAALLILWLSPVMLVIAYAIRRHDRAPILLAYYRVGKGGKIFKLIKFRTTHWNAHERLEQALQGNPTEMARYLKGDPLLDDPRVTPIGRLLRKTNLDELPGLLNVIRGEMALIGPPPRPLSMLKESKDIPKVPPGMAPSWRSIFAVLFKDER